MAAQLSRLASGENQGDVADCTAAVSAERLDASQPPGTPARTRPAFETNRRGSIAANPPSRMPNNRSSNAVPTPTAVPYTSFLCGRASSRPPGKQRCRQEATDRPDPGAGAGAKASGDSESFWRIAL